MSDIVNRVTRLEHWLSVVVVGGLILFVGAAWALFAALSGQIDGLGNRLASVEQVSGRLDERTASIQKQLDAADIKAGKIDEKIDKLLSR